MRAKMINISIGSLPFRVLRASVVELQLFTNTI